MKDVNFSFKFCNRIRFCSVLVGIGAILLVAPAHAQDLNLERQDNLIQWPDKEPWNASGDPRAHISEYKDIQIAHSADGSTFLLYAPVTRPTGNSRCPSDPSNTNRKLYPITLFKWDSAAGGFVASAVTRTGVGEIDAMDIDVCSQTDTYDADFVDIDNDGDQDIVHSSPHGNFIYVNDGADVFTDQTSARLPLYFRQDCTNVWDDVGTGDINGDGFADLVFSNRTFNLGCAPGAMPAGATAEERDRGPSGILYNDGSGRFGRAQYLFGENYSSVQTDQEHSSHGIEFADINNDGRLDLMISHLRRICPGAVNDRAQCTVGTQDTAGIEFRLNEGNTEGVVSWGALRRVADSGLNAGVINIEVFDYDNDGDLDVYAATGGQDSMYENHFISGGPLAGTVEFTRASAQPSSNGTSYDAAAADLDADGFTDIIVMDADGGRGNTNRIFRNNAGAGFVAINIADANSEGRRDYMTLSTAVADIDSDGRLDMIWGADARSDRVTNKRVSTTGSVSALVGPVRGIFLRLEGQEPVVADDLDTMTDGENGAILVLSFQGGEVGDPATPRAPVTVRHNQNGGTDDFLLMSAADVVLDDPSEQIWLQYNGSRWVEIPSGGGHFQTLGVLKNTTPSATDSIRPRFDAPATFLKTAQATEPSAVFRVRITDRVADLDEISGTAGGAPLFEWTTQGDAGVTRSGTSELRWVSKFTYQAEVACSAMTQGFASDEQLTSIGGAIRARDRSGNIGQFQTGSETISAAEATTLAANLNADVISSVAPVMIDVDAGPMSAVLGSGGLIVVRVSLSPAGLSPDIDDISVQIAGLDAPVIGALPVGTENWLLVRTPSFPGATPSGLQDIEVSYRVCAQTLSTTLSNGVEIIDNPVSDVAIVVDSSGSMRDNDKIDAASNAAKLLIDALADEDRLSVQKYNGAEGGCGLADAVFPTGVPRMESAQPTTRSNAGTSLATLDPAGSTSIGAGLLQGLAALNENPLSEPDRVRAVVLLSDGLENKAPKWDTDFDESCDNGGDVLVADTFSLPENEDITRFAISFAPSADTDLMSRIASSADHHLAVEVEPSGPTAFLHTLLDSPVQPAAIGRALDTLELPHRLANVYEHTNNEISFQQRLWHGSFVTEGPTVELISFQALPLPLLLQNGVYRPGEVDLIHTQELPRPNPEVPVPPRALVGEVIEIPIEPSLDSATVSINWIVSNGMSVSLFKPDGTIVTSSDIVRGDTNTVFHLSNPQGGVWKLALNSPKGRRVMITVSGRSEEQGILRALLDHEEISIGSRMYSTLASPAPGTTIPLVLALAGQAPVTNANVIGIASSFSNGQEPLLFKDDGLGLDKHAGDGFYTSELKQTSRGGLIRVDVHANWQGSDGVTRQRLFPLTVSVDQPDRDSDSIPDEREVTNGLDPDRNDGFLDADGDGLPTWQEVLLETDPFKRDTDGGKLSDRDEFCIGSDPLDKNDDDFAQQDTDADGMPDMWEVRFGLDPNNKDDAKQDPDNDGLTNLEEFENCTSPINSDTDGDMISDPAEIEAGTNPLDPFNRGNTENEDLPDQQPETHNYLFWLCILISLVLLIIVIILCWKIQRLKST